MSHPKEQSANQEVQPSPTVIVVPIPTSDPLPITEPIPAANQLEETPLVPIAAPIGLMPNTVATVFSI